MGNLNRRHVICVFVAVLGAPQAWGQAMNVPPPPLPPQSSKPADFDRAQRDAEARDRLRPKAVRPKTQADVDREKATAAAPIPQ